MAVQVSWPGVYIEEFAPAPPIEGVGSSTAAFIGVAAQGELLAPTKVTSWDQFRATFGEQPVPGYYLWYAVRGFFENGGQVCYVVRASNGRTDALEWQNVKGAPLFAVRARQPGKNATPREIRVQVAAAHQLPAASTHVYRPTGNYTGVAGRTVTLTPGQAAQFRPGDFVALTPGPTSLRVASVSGDALQMAEEVSGHAGSGTVRLANLPVGARTLRVEPTGGPLPPEVLVPGTMLTFRPGTANADSQVVEHVQVEPGATTTYRVTLRQGLRQALDLTQPAGVQSEEFQLAVSQGGATTPYPNLAADPAHPHFYLDRVNGGGGLVRVEPIEPPPPDTGADSLPKVTGPTALTGGENEDLGALTAAHLMDALASLRGVDDVNLIAVPDAARLAKKEDTAAVQQAVLAQCEQLADRFAILDARPGLPLFAPPGKDSVEEQRRGLDSTRGYGAFYYPWLRALPATPGPPILVPPSGHTCGLIARVDISRGVHKAPGNEIVNGALGVERVVSDVEQGQVNLQGVNIIRVFQSGGRPMIYGARTTATDRNWQHVNVRRLFLYLEESIQEGIRWAVFEPNTTGLWAKLRRSIGDFLNRAWRAGALFGATAEEAYYVRIDDVLNPPDSRALGRLHIEIGVQPAYPAEFIVVRIGIWQGGAEVAEA